MARVRVVPETFTMVAFDAATIASLAEEVAGRIGFPDDVEVAIEVDEGLPLPLTGSAADVIDGRADLWFSGGNFEHPQHRGVFDETSARVWLGRDLLRVADRLSAPFAGAPADEDLTPQQRAVWDLSADGRLARLGFEVREPLRRYHFRLAHGFNDVVEEVFERLWKAESSTWADLESACAATAAVDTREKPKDRPRFRRDSLRASSAS
jgi:hypothetical protein